MCKYHKPLGSHETSIVIQAAIEGLTVEQLVAREEFVRLGFSQEQAARFIQVRPSPSEENWNRLQEAMRELGWAEDQVEQETGNTLNTINGVFDETSLHFYFPRKETP